MRVAIAQINSTVGDFKSNAKKITEYIQRAQEHRCDLVVFPELSLFGYWAADLLERTSVVEEQLKYIKQIQKIIPKEIAVLFGAVTKTSAKTGRLFQNSALFMQKGRKPLVFHKELLPTYDIFDEYRHFEFGDMSKNILSFRGKKILITICEDIWAWPNPNSKYRVNPLLKLKGKKIDLVVNLSASPFSLSKFERRKKVVLKTAQFFKAPVIYTNLVGGQDEIIFDGGSFAMDKNGKMLAHSIHFDEDLNVVDLKLKEGGHRQKTSSRQLLLKQALVFGLREFIEKNGFKKVHLGLSGGIDSAVVACLAVDAIGAGRVTGVALPSEFNAPESLQLAQTLAKNLGITFKEVSIQPAYETLKTSLNSVLGPMEFSTVHENLQARLRGVILMAFSNFQNSLLLTTGNKSEYATGYSTLYGDMCGGLAPIADLVKRQVYELAELYNQEHELIPKKIITRAPSAELRPNQKDQDTLPPYDELDVIVEKLVENFGSAKTKNEKWVLNRMYTSEFKRWQAPPILRVSEHSFGRGRRFPITNKARS